MSSYLQISSGRGPGECSWVVSKLLEYLLDYTKKKEGLELEVIDRVPDSTIGLHSALLKISGADAKKFMDEWQGTILWKGQSTLRPQHKRKNWFVSLFEFVIPEEIKLKKEDLKIQAVSAQGPGGQHINRSKTAIRLLHIPTGIVVTAQDERSQKMNKELALLRLTQLIAYKNQNSLSFHDQKRWQQHNELERGNPVKIFKGKNFNLEEL